MRVKRLVMIMMMAVGSASYSMAASLWADTVSTVPTTGTQTTVMDGAVSTQQTSTSPTTSPTQIIPEQQVGMAVMNQPAPVLMASSTTDKVTTPDEWNMTLDQWKEFLKFDIDGLRSVFLRRVQISFAKGAYILVGPDGKETKVYRYAIAYDPAAPTKVKIAFSILVENGKEKWLYCSQLELPMKNKEYVILVWDEKKKMYVYDPRYTLRVP